MEERKVKLSSGAINSSHYFGRSFMKRQGNSYYLAWQQANKVVTVSDAILLTRKQYTTIKFMLGPVYKEIKTDYTWIKFHRNPRKVYYKIKKYLKEERLWP
jgi:hypothetical protein